MKDHKKSALQTINKKCDVQSAQVACIIFLDDKPIWTSVNKRGPGKVSRFTQHAEELAVRRIKNMSLLPHYVSLLCLRFTKNGSTSIAKPCKGCMRLLTPLMKKGLIVRYSDREGFIVRLQCSKS